MKISPLSTFTLTGWLIGWTTALLVALSIISQEPLVIPDIEPITEQQWVGWLVFWLVITMPFLGAGFWLVRFGVRAMRALRRLNQGEEVITRGRDVL